MNKKLEELKQTISDLDDHTKLYILGFIQGQLFELKEFSSKEE